ncbi:NACHT, LRR and PYD domains-containing protein 1-like [Thomomys bottae]
MAGRSYRFSALSALLWTDSSESEEETAAGENETILCAQPNIVDDDENLRSPGSSAREGVYRACRTICVPALSRDLTVKGKEKGGEKEAVSISAAQFSTVEENLESQASSVRGTKEKFQNLKTEEASSAHFRKNEDLQQKFSQLLLVEKPHCRGQDVRLKKSWHQDEMEELRPLIDIGDLFDPKPDTQEEPQTVVLYGPAGIGKSTLARQVKGGWEEGQLYRDRFQHVVFINCRELDQHKLLSLDEVIMEDSSVPLTESLARPEQLLFIIDGVDELQLVTEEMNLHCCPHWSQPQLVRTLVCNLLGRIIFPEASLLITTQTTALQKFIPFLKRARWVAVLGFSESSRKEYFYKYFPEENQAIKAFSLVESNPALMSLCLVPWVSWLVCTCLKQQMERGEECPLTPQTTTALCLHYLVQTLPAQLLGAQLRKICSLAAMGIWQTKTLFSADDLSKCGLDSAIIITFLEINVLQKHNQSQSYSFTHSCFQAFFTALTLVLMDEEENMDSPALVTDMIRLMQRYRSHLSPSINFLFGLLSKPVVDELEVIFMCKLRRLRLLHMLHWMQFEASLGKLHSMEIFYLLYESQNERILSSALGGMKETRMCIQTDVEFLVVTFCLKFCRQVKRLQLHSGGQNRDTRRSSGVVLSVRGPLTSSSWKIFFSTLEGSKHLEELDLTGNLLSSSTVQSLCDTLRHCQLETLRLAHCGLTDSCCRALASALHTSSSLRNLYLQQNNLGDNGVRMLCKELKQPSSNLTYLCLDQDSLSEPVKQELRNLELYRLELIISSECLDQNSLRHLLEENLSILELENPEQILSSGWKPSVMSPTKGQDRGELDKSIPSHEWQRQSPDDLQMKCMGKKYDFWGPVGHVAIDVVEKQRSLYRVHFPVAGSYHCPSMRLGFVVSRAVTVTIEFCSWSTFLDEASLQHSWMVAGPLFDITAEQGAVSAVHLPHFVSLQDEQVDISQFHVAHMKEEGMLLEKPARVEPHCAVLENPSFSPVGVLLRIIPKARRFIRLKPTTLLYHHCHPEDVTFHLYLIPDDPTIQKAIDDKEEKFQFVGIYKPPPQDNLYFGSRYTVSGSESLEIIPKELKFCYRSPGESQLFSEISVANLGSGIELQMTNKLDGALLWEAKVKPGELSNAANVATRAPAASDALPSLHFVDKQREQLVARVTCVDSVLDLLLGKVLSEQQYEQVRAEATRPAQMRKLFSFSPSWDQTCKDQLYHALKETHPHLIMELWEKSSHSHRP